MTDAARQRRINRNGPSVNPLPLSEAVRFPDGSTLYSRDTNRILCAAERGAGARRETWLGTRYGVKCIDRYSGTVRHYSSREGLPNGSVPAIAADASGVWCLVVAQPSVISGQIQPTKNTLFLCAFDTASGRWKTLREVPASTYGGGQYDYYGGDSRAKGRLLVATAPGFVAFVVHAPVNAPSDESVVLLWDKKTRKFEEVPWEPGLRADNIALGVHFLLADRSGVWLGTSLGLLRWDRAARGGGVWRRFLPESVVENGAVTPEVQIIWVTVRDRDNRPWRGGRDFPRSSPPSIPPPVWRLVRVNLTSGAVREWTPPRLNDPSTEFAVQIADSIQRGTMERPVDDLGRIAPLGVTVAANGVVWTSHRSINLILTPGLYTGGNGRDGSGGFACFDPKTEAWAAHPLRLRTEGGRPAFPPFPSHLELAARDTAPENGSEATPGILPFTAVPDAAVQPLALVGLRPAGEYGDTEIFWIRRRFPEWLCPDDTAAAEADSKVGERVAPGAVSVRRWASAERPGITIPLPDPSQPGSFWLMDYTGETLLRLPEDKIPPALREARRSGIFYPAPPFPLDDPGIEKFPFPPNAAITVRPNVQQLLPGGGEGGSSASLLWVVMQDNLSAWEEHAQKWVSFPLPGRDTFFNAYNPVLLPDGDDGSVLFLGALSNSSLLRYEGAKGTFTVLPPAAQPPFGAHLLARAADGGIWFRGNNGHDLLFAPAAARRSSPSGSTSDNAVVQIPEFVTTSADGNKPAPQVLAVAAADKIGWRLLAGQGESHTPVLVGYDVEKRAWTAAQPLEMRYSSRRLPLLGDGMGGAYFAADNAAGSVYHYLRATNRWEIAAPALPALRLRTDVYPPPTLVGVDADRVFLVGLGRYLLRYDRRLQKWETEFLLLPDALGLQDSSESDIAAARVGGTVFVGGTGGLFRHTMAAKGWEPLEYGQPVRLGMDSSRSTGARGAAFNWRDIAVTHNALYGTAFGNSGSRNFGVRLNLVTHQWTVFDEKSGFPERGYSRLVVDENGAWLIHSNGTYRLSTQDDHWHLVFHGSVNRSSGGDAVPSAALLRSENPALATPISTGDVIAIVADAEKNEAFLLVNMPVSVPDRTGSSYVPLAPVVWRWDLKTNMGVRLSSPPTEATETVRNARAQAAVGLLPGIRFQTGNGTALLLDAETLWVGTQRGLFRVPRAGGEWQPAALPLGSPLLSPDTLAVDSGGGGLWIISNENVLHWKKRE